MAFMQLCRWCGGVTEGQPAAAKQPEWPEREKREGQHQRAKWQNAKTDQKIIEACKKPEKINCRFDHWDSS